jgi:uncharacterized membrane protein YgaE (UPF0421/DUF939 family)
MKLSISKQEWLYVIKCTLGAVICYWLYVMLPQYPLFWSLVSVVLVISPENDRKLAYTRMEGNFLGSAIGLLVFFLPLPTVFILCLGISLTIITGLLLKLTASVRTAVAATIIVLFQEESAHSWIVAVQRVACVVLGCIVGFIITFAFVRIENIIAKRKSNSTN